MHRPHLEHTIALTLACVAPLAAAPLSGPAAAPSTNTSPPALAADTHDTRLLEQPAVSAQHVAFVYAGDLWVAPLAGGAPQRLTSHPGQESRPRFSPDGAWIAFSGQYDGNTDVYLVPVAGGEPTQLTWHPGADLVQGFTPDGAEVLFTSQREVHSRRFWQLFRVSAAGGPATRFPLPTCFKAELSPDGRRIAYVPLAEAFNQWKNYRGGTASRVWICELADLSVTMIPQPAGRCNDTDPMWVGTTLYFRSDRDGEFNLYRFDAATGNVRALTQHTDFPVANTSAGAGQIVYEQAGWLHLLDPAQGTSKRLVIGVATDLVETRERWVGGAEHVRSASVSPSGARAAFGFRGEIVTVPAEKGDPRNLTDTPGANERHPSWSPDGRWLAYVSDDGGENRIVLAPHDGKGERRVLDPGGAGFYDALAWSPDSKKLSFHDNSRSLYWLDVESGVSTRIAGEPIYGVLPSLHHAWSPDSRWIAYTLGTQTGFRTAHLCELATGASHALSDGLADVSEPVFDAGGKYLYLAASTDAGPFLTWFSQASADIEETNSLYVVVLAKDEPSPFAPESDEEEPKAAATEGETPSASDESKATEAADSEKDAGPTVRIDLDGLANRILALPLPRAHYSNLQAGKAGELWYLKTAERAFSADDAGPSGGARPELARFDLASEKEQSALAGCLGFTVAAGREKALLRTEAGFFLRPLGAPIDLSAGRLALDAVQVRIDPRAEWAQILDEVWRINRDYFYDPGMHGADWPAMKARYEQFLPHLAVRSDLNRVIRWLCSELAVGHSFSGGGETLVKVKGVPGGLLGADYEVVDGRYRFAKVFGGLNWTPDLRAPLTEPGVDVRAGEFLLAVGGEPLTAAEDVHARFVNTAGKRVELSVGPNPDGTDARTVTVVPIEDEGALRNRDWVEGNIARVTEATAGRVAYVYVPDTAGEGHTYFKRYFFPQAGREAVIIDERHNGGGSIADYYMDILRRPYVAHWATRYGEDLVTPQGAIFGPKVMIVDETAGSGGDLLPWMFRRSGLGKLVGRPTWGGLVGILGYPELMDGGSVTSPNLAFWTEEEGFGIENVGVPPDIEVEQLPALVARGLDPQLEKAIEVALEELAVKPPKEAVRPPFPLRARR